MIASIRISISFVYNFILHNIQVKRKRFFLCTIKKEITISWISNFFFSMGKHLVRILFYSILCVVLPSPQMFWIFFFHFHLFMDISSSPSSVQDSELKGKRWRISSNQALLNKHRWWCAEKADFYWLLLLDTVQSDRRQRLVMLLDQDVLAKLWLRALQQRFRVRQMLEMRLIMSTISIG